MPKSYAVTFERNVAVPMRDGTVLYADVYRPAAPGKYPVLLQRTPYDKASGIGPGAFAVRAAGEGYAVVVQDARGRWQSDGSFYAFPNERQDGFDTAVWINEQPWANGRIGMFGQSYVGLTQWQAALGGAPGLQAIVPGVTAADYHEGWTYQGGAFELNFNLGWVLTFLATDTARRRADADPAFKAKQEELLDRIDAMDKEFDRMPLAGDELLRELAPYYDDWLAHPAHGEFWDKLKIDGNYGQLDVAALHVGAWYDIFLGGTIQNFMGMRAGAKTEQARNAQHLLLGPWTHITGITLGPVGEYDPGVRSSHVAIDFDGLHLRWYDRWLRDADNGVDDEPPVRLFVMGLNRWRSEQEWPLARTRYVDWYFASAGRANTLNGDGVLSQDAPGPDGNRPDHYLYDPLDPVPTKGGGLCCNFYWSQAGRYDHRQIETRPDVLCYTSAPLTEDLEVTGPVKVILYAASSARDTDFTAKLLDVCPCGCAHNLTDGIIRARYRESMRTEKLLTPGEIERYEIDLWATSNVFAAGHRIRVEISSSNFPRFDRNPNTGGTIATATKDDCLVATQTVYHDADCPSRIVLPVIAVT
jgi:putative CocE/NonD family hydrolase